MGSGTGAPGERGARLETMPSSVPSGVGGQAPQDPLELFWIAQGNSFLLRHLPQTLIRADEVIAHPPAAQVEGHGEL